MITINSQKNSIASRLRLEGVALLLVIFSTAAQAQLTNIQYTTTSDGNGGLIITQCYASGSGPLVLPSTINGLPVTSLNSESDELSVFNTTDVTSLTIPNGVTSIGFYAFYDRTSLTSVTIPNSVTSIEFSAFSGCTSLTNVTIPNSVTSIGVDAFDGCSSLASVTILNDVIGQNEFSNCTGLTSVTISNAVTSIGELSFAGCSSLTSVMIPNSVTSIGDNAFDQCHNLTSVTIPASVTSIGGSAFDLCTSLTSVVFRGNAPTIGGAFVFDSTASGFTIYYDNGSGFTSPNWTDGYGNNFPAVNLGAFSGDPLGSGWAYSAWFGTYNATYLPWIYRTDLGFIYVQTSDNTNLYLYVVNGNSGSMGWLYTTQAQFPNVYSFSKHSWLSYDLGTTNFYNYTTRAWETY